MGVVFFCSSENSWYYSGNKIAHHKVTERGMITGDDTVADLREALRSRRFSRSKGLRAVADFSVGYAQEHGAPALKYTWLVKFAEGRISDPGFDRAVRLRRIIEAMDQSQP